MAIGTILNRTLKAPHETVDVVKKPSTIAPNQKYVQKLVIAKWMPEGNLAPTKLFFLSDTAYNEWVDSGGPDRDFKDPVGEYFVIRKWEPR